MSDITFSVNYTGTKSELLARLKNMEKQAMEKYAAYAGGVEVRWRDDGGDVDARIMGFDLTAQFDIVERDASGGQVNIAIQLPAMLAMMKGPIEAQLKSEMQKMLGKG